MRFTSAESRKLHSTRTALANWFIMSAGEISRTEQVRLRNSLATSVRNFDQEFSYEFQQLCESFELDPETESSPIENRAARLQSNWEKASLHAELVRGLYIWKTGASHRGRS